jgi:hypothetical protein
VTPGAVLHNFACQNERCRNYGQIVRTVQVNPDGSIPPPIVRREKAFPTVRGINIDQEIAKVNAALSTQVGRETDPKAPKEVHEGQLG